MRRALIGLPAPTCPHSGPQFVFSGAGLMVMASYLCRRNGKFMFRRRIPLDAQIHLRRNELVLSLGDSRPGEARRQAYRLWFESEMMFMELRHIKNYASPAETDAAAQKLLAIFEGKIEADQAAIVAHVEMSGLDEPIAQAARFKGLAAATRVMAGINDTSLAAHIARLIDDPDEEVRAASARVIARKFMKGVPAVAGRAAEDYAQLAKFRAGKLPAEEKFSGEAEGSRALFDAILACKPLEGGGKLPPELQAELEVLTTEVKNAAAAASVAPPTHSVSAASASVSPASAFVSPPSHTNGPVSPRCESPSPGIALASAQPGEDSALMTVLWDRFTAFKVAKKEWKPAQEVKAGSSLTLWLNVHGDRHPWQYRKKDATDFFLLTTSLPHDYYSNGTLRKIYEKDGARAVLEHVQGRPYKKLSSETWNRHFAVLNGFFCWAAEAGMAISPPKFPSIFEGLSIIIPKSKLSKKQQREQARLFLPEELEKLAHTPKFLGCRSRNKWKIPGDLVYRDERYWMTIFGAHLGNRREELAILRVKHVVKSHAGPDGIWYLNLLDPDLEELLKDTGSPREIPLHENILKLGFIEARVEGRDPEAYLFPEAFSTAAVGRQGEPFGKWFHRFRCHHGVDDRRLDYHSYRGTVATGLVDKQVSDAFIESICGWESEGRRSQIAIYDKKDRIKLLKQALDLWEPPFDVAAMIAAVERSDLIDKRAAWPDLVKAEKNRTKKR